MRRCLHCGEYLPAGQGLCPGCGTYNAVSSNGSDAYSDDEMWSERSRLLVVVVALVALATLLISISLVLALLN